MWFFDRARKLASSFFMMCSHRLLDVYKRQAADGAQIPTSIGNLFFSSKANAKSGKFNIDIQSVGLKTLESDLPDGYFIQENFNGSEMPLDWTLSPRCV